MEHVNVKAFETSKNKSLENFCFQGFLALKGRDSPQSSRLHTALHASSAARLLPCGGRNVSPTRFSSPFESLHIPKEKGHFRVLFLLAQRERFIANYVACRAVPPHSRFLCFANLWQEKQKEHKRALLILPKRDKRSKTEVKLRKRSTFTIENQRIVTSFEVAK